jgi:hypothetical protein
MMVYLIWVLTFAFCSWRGTGYYPCFVLEKLLCRGEAIREVRKTFLPLVA